jgi:putative membrane protein
MINYIKALHIIFVVTWFAGLFYIIRLFIYKTEAQLKAEPEKRILTEQFSIMQKRLWYGITWPSSILATIFGFWIFFLNFNYYITQPWMLLKLFFIGGLWIYHIQSHFMYNQQKNSIYKFSSFKLRLYNELATIFLFIIVFLVVVKSTGSLVWSSLGLIILTAFILFGVIIYKKQREKNNWDKIQREQHERK